MTFKDILKITFNLVILYLAGGLLLAAVYARTSPIIYRNNEIEKARALKEMMPEAEEICYIFEFTDERLNKLRDKGVPEEIINKLKELQNEKMIKGKEEFFKTMEQMLGAEALENYKSLLFKTLKANDWYPHGKHAEYFVAKKGGQVIGYIVQTFGKGYSSYIDILFSVDTDFIVQKMNVLHHAETPGLGDEIELDWFKNQFKGKDIEHLKVDKTGTKKEYIQAITGATISTRAVSEDGIRNGIIFLQKALKGEVEHGDT
jgi:electron transport complex protein RnfG